jgi:hypothetical protein
MKEMILIIDTGTGAHDSSYSWAVKVYGQLFTSLERAKEVLGDNLGGLDYEVIQVDLNTRNLQLIADVEVEDEG